jgi:hypothetical protein
MALGTAEIVETVARLEGVDPTELSPQLYQAVNPDALETLLETGSVQVTFAFAGYRITARSNGDIHAKPLETSHPSA